MRKFNITILSVITISMAVLTIAEVLKKRG